MINDVGPHVKLIVVRGVVTIKCKGVIGVVIKAQVSFTVSVVAIVVRRPEESMQGPTSGSFFVSLSTD